MKIMENDIIMISLHVCFIMDKIERFEKKKSIFIFYFLIKDRKIVNYFKRLKIHSCLIFFSIFS